MSRPAKVKGVQMPIYLGEHMDEIRAEAQRLDRSMAWLLRRAWAISRAQIASMPAAPKEES